MPDRSSDSWTAGERSSLNAQPGAASEDTAEPALKVLFSTVVALLAGFYALLGWRAWQWSPSRFLMEAAAPSVWVSLEKSHGIGQRLMRRVGPPPRSALILQPGFATPAPSSGALLAGASLSSGIPETPRDLGAERDSASEEAITNMVERGRWLFYERGCAVCHGMEGSGGVLNPNSEREQVPRLDALAERLQLFDRDEAQAFLRALASEQGVAGLGDDPAILRPQVVVAQYEAVRKLVLSGNRSTLKDPHGKPAIDMPAWEERLSDQEIAEMVAYVVSLYRWEGDGE